ncbi:MAG: hypothetical protein HY718_13870 [Planctomycetes bacterium]|nr:hypothetical protein [Planctomycetota bacterium]
MTVEQIRNALRAQPFRAFSLRTADGREYSVPHQDFLFITPTGRTVIVADTEGTVELIDLFLVASIHFNGEEQKANRGPQD